jgi:hypothetical protein
MPSMWRIVALAAAAGLLAALPSAQARQPAGLRFAGTHPLAVTGHGFVHAEKVRVTVHTGARTTTVRTRANGDGRFRVTFARVTVTTCDPLDVEAVGAHGDRARLLRRAVACEMR